VYSVSLCPIMYDALKLHWSMHYNCKDIYNGREGASSLSSPHHLEKAQKIICTMYHLLLLSLVINEK
jgi:hypothetical protein